MLVSNLDSSLWVPLCNETTSTDCRGQQDGLFSYNDSSTWEEKGKYKLPRQAETSLGYSGTSLVGFDNVILDGTRSGGPSITNSMITNVVDKSFVLSHLGLNHQPLNFSTFDDQYPSLLTSLFEDKKIPSLTWSYTAGARYRGNKKYGSLVLGGYDATRSDVNHNLTVKMPVNPTRDLRLAVTTISSRGKTLLDSRIDAFIDSSVSHIWLPVDVCARFEEAFGLIYDNATQLYLVNDTLHNQLLRYNASVLISVTSSLTDDDPNDSSTIDIILPYGAFDKKATYINPTSRYFPLRRASNPSQYTLGRTFLQEAYLHVDYGRSTFTISQTLFPSDSADPGNIVAVYPRTSKAAISDGTDPEDRGTQPNNGMIAGITIGVVLGVGGLIAPGYLYRRYRHRRASNMALQGSHGNQHKAVENESEEPTAELAGDVGKESDGQTKNRHLLDGREICQVRLHRGRGRSITASSPSPDLYSGGRTPISELISSGSTVKSESDGTNRENREIFELPVQTAQELP